MAVMMILDDSYKKLKFPSSMQCLQVRIGKSFQFTVMKVSGKKNVRQVCFTNVWDAPTQLILMRLAGLLSC